MKVIVTGSLGHISKPLTKLLVQKGHAVTVISSDAAKQQDIEALGADAAVGALTDASFLTEVFNGADAVYTMVPPNDFFSATADVMTHYRSIAECYAQAVRTTGVKRIVHLSSIGAHMEKKSGLILGHRAVEDILNTLDDVDITFMRPVGFYYNLFGFMGMIRNLGFIAANFGADDELAWVAPADIAEAVAAELDKEPVKRRIQYVVSDELSGHETARILGEAIGKPDLKWVLISDDEMLKGLTNKGMNAEVAQAMVEMYARQHSDELMEDYRKNKPQATGKVKIRDFAADFAAAYQQQ